MEKKNNLNVSVDLLKMKAAVLGIKGKNAVKKCVVIPIEDNDLFSKVSDSGKVSVYLNLNCWENNTVSQYGDTHMVKQAHSKEWNAAHSDEEKRNEPILGNAKPIYEKDISTIKVPTGEVVETPFAGQDDSELPF